MDDEADRCVVDVVFTWDQSNQHLVRVVADDDMVALSYYLYCLCAVSEPYDVD
jgi:hypothetical protein